MRRDVSSFIDGSRCLGTEINDIVVSSNIAKKNKNALPCNKTGPKLSNMKHANPLLHQPNNNTNFPPDASGPHMNFHWFTERPWIESCTSTFKVKCCAFRSQFCALRNKNAPISKK